MSVRIVRNEIPGDIFRKIALAVVNGIQCRKLRCAVNCYHRHKCIMAAVKAIRSVCYRASRAISVFTLMCSQYTIGNGIYYYNIPFVRCAGAFRGRHLSWIIRANSSFAVADLRHVRACAEWDRIVSEYYDVHRDWILSTIPAADVTPEMIYNPDFGPPGWKEQLELTQIALSHKWWTYGKFQRQCFPYRGVSDIPFHGEFADLWLPLPGVTMYSLKTYVNADFDGDIIPYPTLDRSAQGVLYGYNHGSYPTPTTALGYVPTRAANTGSSPERDINARLRPRTPKLPKMKWQHNRPSKHKQYRR